MRVVTSLRPVPPWAMGTMVIAILLALGGVATLAIQRMGEPLGEPAQPPRRETVAGLTSCVQTGRDDYCDRIAVDLARRGPLTDEQRDRVIAEIPAVDAATRATTCGPVAFSPRGGPSAEPTRCAGYRPVDRERWAAGPEDAAAVLLSLDAAGFAGSIVRVAAPEDPAPFGSIVFAVPVGEGCIVGNLMAPGGGSPPRPVGKLPDDRCL